MRLSGCQSGLTNSSAEVRWTRFKAKLTHPAVSAHSSPKYVNGEKTHTMCLSNIALYIIHLGT